MGIQLNVDDDDLMYDIIHICCHHINDKNKLIYSNSIFEWFCRMDIEPKFVDRAVCEPITVQVLDILQNLGR